MDYPKFAHYTDKFQKVSSLCDIHAEFSRQATAENRFEFTRALMKKHNMLPKTLDKVANYKRNMYDRDSSYSIRCMGNRHFKIKQYTMALTCYNHSLTKSEPGTECHAYVFANRSAVFFHLDEYQQCLDDIRRALRSKYPANLKYKLYERAGNAERMLGRGELAKTNYLESLKFADKSSMSAGEKREFKIKVTNAIENCKGLVEKVAVESNVPVDNLLGGKNEKIPALSKYLELGFSKDMGRGVYATRDINPGDVVAIDEAYIGGGSTTFVNVVCHYAGCLRRSMGLIPCPKCLLAKFCNEECIQKANLEGHNLECLVIYSIKKIPGIQKINELALKWFSKECSKMGIEKYCLVVNNLMKTKIGVKTRGFDENGQYKSESFSTAFTLENSGSEISTDVLFFFNCISVEILQYLILSDFNIPESFTAIAGTSLVQMLIVLDSNCHKLNLCAPLPPSSTENITSLAYALYPSTHLFNHSCDPNVLRGGLLIDFIRPMKAIQYIPKGSQLFISYGVLFKVNDKKSRKIFCKNRFGFKCACQPCYENWPTGQYIPNRISSLNLLNPKMADTVTMECKKFLDFQKTASQYDCSKHINYLYSFHKFMLTNVKRPFKLHEECITLIDHTHAVLPNFEQKIFSECSNFNIFPYV